MLTKLKNNTYKIRGTSIIVTDNGLQIAGKLLAWDELDMARRSIKARRELDAIQKPVTSRHSANKLLVKDMADLGADLISQMPGIDLAEILSRKYGKPLSLREVQRARTVILRAAGKKMRSSRGGVAFLQK